MLALRINMHIRLIIIIIFFGSVQLIGIGVLGEYLSKTYIESKRRPTYLIRKLDLLVVEHALGRNGPANLALTSIHYRVIP